MTARKNALTGSNVVRRILSALCLLFNPPKRPNVAKNWSCPLNPGVATKLRMEKALINRS